MEWSHILSPRCMDSIVILPQGKFMSLESLLTLRILRSSRFCCCRGQIPLHQHSAVYTGDMVLHCGLESLSLDLRRQCSPELLPRTSIGESCIRVMNRIFPLTISIGLKIRFSTLALPEKEVFHGLVQQVNSRYGSCVVLLDWLQD